MRMVWLSLVGFGLGFAASIGVFYGIHFLYSASRHGGWF